MSKELDEILETIVREHEEAQPVGQNKGHKDFVAILLSCMDTYDDQHNFVIDRTNIKAILLDMLAGSLDTSATVVLWAFPELLRNPRVMKKLQHELENQVGRSQMVEEADLPRLTYLDVVIKETMRLYPVAPFLVPRECREDITINGYYIKKSTRIMVNAWSIGRDTKIWSHNVESFYPERFLDSNMDYRRYKALFLLCGKLRREREDCKVPLLKTCLAAQSDRNCDSCQVESSFKYGKVSSHKKWDELENVLGKIKSETKKPLKTYTYNR